MHKTSFFYFLLLAFFNTLSLSAASTTQEQTLAIIKPNGVAEKHIGDILSRYEQQGFRIAALKMLKLSPADAEKFYAVHKDRPFFKDLTTSMSTGPIVAIVLEGPNAVAANRDLMGATDPQKASKGTIRADFGKSITANAIHGSDSPENAKTEIAFFFKPSDIY